MGKQRSRSARCQLTDWRIPAISAMSLNADLSGTSVLLIQPLELEMGPLEPFLKSLSFTLEGDP